MRAFIDLPTFCARFNAIISPENHSSPMYKAEKLVTALIWSDCRPTLLAQPCHRAGDQIFAYSSTLTISDDLHGLTVQSSSAPAWLDKTDQK